MSFTFSNKGHENQSFLRLCMKFYKDIFPSSSPQFPDGLHLKGY